MYNTFSGALLVPHPVRVRSMNAIASLDDKSITDDGPMIIDRPRSVKCSLECRNSERPKAFCQWTRLTFIDR